MNLNSVNQMLGRALLGMQFKPLHINAPTVSAGPVIHTVGTGLKDITEVGPAQTISNIDELLTIIMQATSYSIGSVVFTGAGLNDATSGGTYAPAAGPSSNHTYVVEISATGAPDHFTVAIDGGAPSAPIAITGSAQAIGEGVTIAFLATTGHTLHNLWTITVTGVDQFKWKLNSGSLSSGVGVTGDSQGLYDSNNGTTISFGATVGHTPGDQFTILISAGVSLPSAVALGNIAFNQVGAGMQLNIYDGNSTNGTLLYEATSSNWTDGDLQALGYALQNAQGLYVALTPTTPDEGTNPDLIIGYN